MSLHEIAPRPANQIEAAIRWQLFEALAHGVDAMTAAIATGDLSALEYQLSLMLGNVKHTRNALGE